MGAHTRFRVHVHMKRFTLPALASLTALGALAGCNVGTDNVAPGTGPFTVVTAVLKDSTQFPAGTPVIVTAHVTHDGLPIPTVGVAYTVLSGKGTVSAATATTDTLGVVSVTWLLADSAGVNSLAITSGDGADTLRLIGVIGSPSALVPSGSDSTSVAVGTGQALQVRVVDRAGNSVANAVVNWSATGGTLSSASGTSDSTGNVSTTFTPTQAGEFLITADLPNKASVVFKVVAQ